MIEEVNALLNESNKFFIPPTDEKTSEWSELYRVKSTETSRTGGKWKNISWQVEIMDSWDDPEVEEIIFVKPAQSGATEILLNIIGKTQDKDPAGMGVVVPTQDDVRIFSKTRFDTMVRDCKPLRQKRLINKKSNNSQTLKIFPGGYVRIVGAGTPREVAGMPVPYMLFDEVDKYEASSEGDIISLGLERIKMQDGRKAYIASTPTLAGESRIHALYETSDRRKFWVSCVHCGKEQLLMFKNLKWDKAPGKKGKKVHKPETAYYLCENRRCRKKITDAEKNEMVSGGRWIAEAPLRGRAGFHINEFYSPFRTFVQIASSFIDKKDDPETLQVFINAVLGEVYNMPCEEMKSSALLGRVEKYYHEKPIPLLPQGGAVLTAGVDVQHDRLEAVVRLWGKGAESWGIEYYVFKGDPYQDIVWNRLDELISKKYTHASGVQLKIDTCAIDTGYATERVYEYINRVRGPATAIKGRGGAGEPVARNSTKPDKLRVPLHTIGVDTAKNTLYKRSHIMKAGPGKIHWNQNFTEQYFEQFTSEKLIKKMRAGQESYAWVKPSGRANEAFDCEVYAYAALWIAAIPNMAKLVDRLDPEYIKEQEKKEKEKQKNTPKKKKNWATNI